MSTEPNEVLVLKGTLQGHNGWVTSLSTCAGNPDLLLSSSRDKTLIAWQLTKDDQQYGIAKRAFKGHSHIVQDCQLTPDGQYAISGSWDKTLRLWRIEDGETVCRFDGHTSDVMSVSITRNVRQFVSASRDKTVKVWNSVGKCLTTLKSHQDWVSSVECSPSENTIVYSAGWDKAVKTWDIADSTLLTDFVGHNGYISNITISPDGSLCASGGKDGSIQLWDLASNTLLFTLLVGDEINALAFSPNRFWLAVATSTSVKVFHLKERTLIDELKPEVASGKTPECISLAWSTDGQNLFSGYTDDLIRVWQVMTSA